MNIPQTEDPQNTPYPQTSIPPSQKHRNYWGKTFPRYANYAVQGIAKNMETENAKEYIYIYIYILFEVLERIIFVQNGTKN